MNIGELASLITQSVPILEQACSGDLEQVYALIGATVEEVASDALTALCPAYGIARAACGVLPPCIEALVSFRTRAVKTICETFCLDALLEAAVSVYCALPSELRGAVQAGAVMLSQVSEYISDPLLLVDYEQAFDTIGAAVDAGRSIATSGVNLLARSSETINDVVSTILSELGLPVEITSRIQDLTDALIIEPLSGAVNVVSDVSEAVVSGVETGVKTAVSGAKSVAKAAVCWTGLC